MIISLCRQVKEIKCTSHAFVPLYFCQKIYTVNKYQENNAHWWTLQDLGSGSLLKAERNWQSCLHCVIICNVEVKASLSKVPQYDKTLYQIVSPYTKKQWCLRHRSKLLNVLMLKHVSLQVKCTQQFHLKIDLPSVWNIICTKWDFINWGNLLYLQQTGSPLRLNNPVTVQSWPQPANRKALKTFHEVCNWQN